MTKDGSEDAPKIEAPHEEFTLHIRQAEFALDEWPRVGAYADIVAQVTGIEGRAEGKEYRRSRDLDGGSVIVSVVLAFVAHVVACFYAVSVLNAVLYNLCEGKGQWRCSDQPVA